MRFSSSDSSSVTKGRVVIIGGEGVGDEERIIGSGVSRGLGGLKRRRLWTGDDSESTNCGSLLISRSIAAEMKPSP